MRTLTLENNASARLTLNTSACWARRVEDGMTLPARTIADLAGRESIRPTHLAEALQYWSRNLVEA